MKTLFFRVFIIISLVGILSSLSSCKEDEQNGEVEPQRVAGNHDILPLPNRINFFDSKYELSGTVTINMQDNYSKAGQVLVNELSNYGISATFSKSEADIIFIENEELAEEEYVVEVGNEGVTLSVNSEKGAFYAAQSLRQYFWTSDYVAETNKLNLQGINIKDKADNEYRGFHIDVARHFFPKEFIFKIIDQMALYKLNKLQIHLTDDQGWRIPISKYPKLTTVGGYREFDRFDEWCIKQAESNADYNFDPNYVSGNTYGGYYTKQELIDIVEYAADHYIEVIPEIDMPGHMSAAIKAYPWIGGGDVEWGGEFSKPMAVYDEKVMQFSKDVWDEVLEIFPSTTVHIGADEVEKSFWENSEECQVFMAENNMPHVNMVQSYFVDEMTKYLEGKGKKVIAWDDVMVSNHDDIVNNVSSSLDIMYWRNYKADASVYAARNGNQIILTPWDWFYISSDNTEENLSRLYNFDETAELDPIVVQNKKGYQACVWTEHIPSETVFEKFVFPRFQAFAEVAWSKGKNYDSFKKRIKTHLQYMDGEKINYRRPDFIQ